MKVGDLVFNDHYGKGVIVQQQGVVDRWFVRWFTYTEPTVPFIWGSKLEVISASR